MKTLDNRFCIKFMQLEIDLLSNMECMGRKTTDQYSPKYSNTQNTECF